MPDPSGYDNEDDFISACIQQRQDEHPEEDTEQSAAICYSMWSDKSMSEIVHKTHATDSAGLEFILSDETPDRYDDVISANGWDLNNFSKNPIALFNHNPDFPVGRWINLGVKDGGLRGHLLMAPEGTSERHDEMRKLIEAGILKAVSVGFRPIESSPRKESTKGGLFYGKSELVETSVVSVPANPNALAVAKMLRISDETRDLVFAKHGDETIFRRNGLVYETRSVWRGEEVVTEYHPYVK